jgi:polysaccharide export outer membrane protein
MPMWVPWARHVRVSATICLLVLGGTAFAQSIQLSPAQQQMLNQLPPAQRQQAMDAISQLNSQQSTSNQQTINEPIEQSASTIGSVDIDQILASAKVTAQARSRLVVNFNPIDSLTSTQRQDLSEDLVLQKLIGSHLFVLDDSGVLSLQGLELIPLLGLTEDDINRRLAAEPFLSLFDIGARILGQKPIGVEALEPFGYDVFEPRQASISAPSSGPVPPDYVLGPGDSVRVQLFGNVNGIYEYEVSRDGVLNLPEIGPVTVAGIPFSEFRADLNKRVQQMLIGTQVSVTMGQLRTIRVFVLGDVNQPGSYVVSGLATIGEALYRSGGVSPVGSLRNIQLKRNGKLVSSLDAYDLLIRGDTSGIGRLQPGDVIFVPPIGKTVSVSGAVNRPAIYEVLRLTSAADLVGLAGGLTPEAFPGGARIQRIEENGERTVLSVNLGNESANSIRVRTGDTLLIPEVLPEIENAVVLAGHAHRPGNFPWRPGMRLTDLIESTEELKPGVDTNYVLVRREGKRGEPIEALSASLSAALQAPGADNDILLEPGDTVNVFSLALGRQRVVEPLLEELELQATIDSPVQQVEVSGNVRAPGVYPLESGMRISDLVRAGGNLSEGAYALEAELTRYSVQPGGGRETEIVKVDLYAIRRGDENADIELNEHDYLIIKRIPDWDSIWTITLEGEVVFPGSYRVRRGETLAEVIKRAGGLAPGAHPEGAVFLRESLREKEQEQIETLARRMETDLASLSLQAADSGGSDTLSTGRVLLDQLRNTEAVGRLVIQLDRDGQDSASEIELRDGDQLLIPTATQVVTVLGETQQNTSHLYQSGMSRDDYIDRSGGLTRRADKKLIYVVRASGAVVAGNRSKWLGRGHKLDIRPGDTIVVPLNTDRMRPLAFWGDVTQILYQAAIAVAAINSF